MAARDQARCQGSISALLLIHLLLLLLFTHVWGSCVVPGCCVVAVCLTSTAAYEACKVCLFRLKVCIFSEHYSLIMFVTDVFSLRQLPTGSILVQVPKGMKPGEAFVLDVKKRKVHDTLGARQQALVQQLPKSRKVSHIVAYKQSIYSLLFLPEK